MLKDQREIQQRQIVSQIAATKNLGVWICLVSGFIVILGVTDMRSKGKTKKNLAGANQQGTIQGSTICPDGTDSDRKYSVGSKFEKHLAPTQVEVFIKDHVT